MTRARHTSENARQAKAWVNFDGRFATSPFTEANGGIRGSFNVTSVTDDGTGIYTINLTNALEDANFTVVGSAGDTITTWGDRQISAYPLTSSTCRVVTGQTATTNTYESSQCHIAIFR